METQVSYVANTPVVIGQEQETESKKYWYHNGAAVAAMILLLNAIALGWVSIFIEHSWIIGLMIMSLFFAIMLGAMAKGEA